VCPDASRHLVLLMRLGRGLHACRIELAGESPVLVIAGEPGSRLQLSGEIPPAERSVKSPTTAVRPSGGKRSCGPSVERTLQPRDISPRKGGDGRAGHVAAKATDCIRRSGGMQDAPGVRRRARNDSSIRNRRGSPRLLTSSEGVAYKRKAKGRRAGRESEGFVVPTKLGESRDEGRGPALGLSCTFGGRRLSPMWPETWDWWPNAQESGAEVDARGEDTRLRVSKSSAQAPPCARPRYSASSSPSKPRRPRLPLQHRGPGRGRRPGLDDSPLRGSAA
jgi:hypothetical protein